jgi:hypothetical protein
VHVLHLLVAGLIQVAVRDSLWSLRRENESLFDSSILSLSAEFVICKSFGKMLCKGILLALGF